MSICPFVQIGEFGQSEKNDFVQKNTLLQALSNDFRRFGQKDSQNGEKNYIYTFYEKF